MDKTNQKIMAVLSSWLVAFAAGTLAGTLLWVLGGWSFLQAAFVGFLVLLIVGGIITWIMLTPLPAPNERELSIPPVPSGTPPSATPPKTAVPSAPAPTAKPAPVAAPVPAAKPESVAAAPAAKKAPAKKKAAAKKADAAPAKASDERPDLMMDGPEGGQADDLKKITGVGPKLEQTLNDLGIWHYSQVAKLKKKDIAWVDERLRFKGRIERDDWVGQAKELAKAKS